jgi:hypothetical protein
MSAPITREAVQADVERARARGNWSAARDLDHFGSLAVMLQEWATRAHARNVQTWLTESHVGARGESRGGYVITERGTGYAVVTFSDGETLTVYAPAPVA